MARTELKTVAHVTELLGETGRYKSFFGTFLRLNYYFAANFRQVFKDETVVFKRYFVPLIQDGL